MHQKLLVQQASLTYKMVVLGRVKNWMDARTEETVKREYRAGTKGCRARDQGIGFEHG